MGVFPSQEHCRPQIRKDRSFDSHSCYIGTWPIKTANAIANELRKEGFGVKVFGRGPRPKRRYEMDRNDVSIKQATHAALYIRGEEIIADNSPSFSLIFADTEHELKTLLMTIQALPEAKIAIDPEIENHIAILVEKSRLYGALTVYGYEQVGRPISRAIKYIRQGEEEKIIINKDILKWDILGDLMPLVGKGTYFEYYPKEEVIHIHKFGFIDVYIKAKHTPVFTKDNLVRVILADGKTAWLTPETLHMLKSKGIN